jgi:nicotinate-nucleotide adenylyltransferase
MYRNVMVASAPSPQPPTPSPRYRLGIFGGSFDPVHNGHLALARACQQQAALDEIWFVPTAIQPLKHGGPQATDAQRLEMLRLATSDESSWRVCTLEIDRGGRSYTVDTLRQIHEELPEAELFFLMGADVIRDVPRWKEPDEIFSLATAVIVTRVGKPPEDAAVLKLISLLQDRPLMVEMPAQDVSSSEIRRRCAANEPIDGFVPPPVGGFIAANNLYR